MGNGLHIIGALAPGGAYMIAGCAGRRCGSCRRRPTTRCRQPSVSPDFLAGVGFDDIDPIDVVVPDVPVRLRWETRFRVRDVRRELVLLSRQQEGGVDGVPRQMVDLATKVDPATPAGPVPS